MGAPWRRARRRWTSCTAPCTVSPAAAASSTARAASLADTHAALELCAQHMIFNPMCTVQYTETMNLLSMHGSCQLPLLAMRCASAAPAARSRVQHL